MRRADPNVVKVLQQTPELEAKIGELRNRRKVEHAALIDVLDATLEQLVRLAAAQEKQNRRLDRLIANLDHPSKPQP